MMKKSTCGSSPTASIVLLAILASVLPGCSHTSSEDQNQAAASRENYEWFVLLASPLPNKLLPNVQADIQELVTSTASPGDIVHFIETPTHGPIARVTVPEGSSRSRLRKRDVASEFQKLAARLDEIVVTDNSSLGQVQIANLPTTIRSLRSTDFATKVIVVGNPVYDDPRHEGWSMVGGFVPTDASPRFPECPLYNTVSFPMSTSISWLVPDAAWGADRRHRDAAVRFYRLLCQQYGAYLARMSPDSASVFHSPENQFSGIVVPNKESDPGVWHVALTSGRKIDRRKSQPSSVALHNDPKLPEHFGNVQAFLDESLSLSDRISFAIIWNSDDPNADVDMWISDSSEAEELNPHKMKTRFGQFFRDVTISSGAGRNAQDNDNFECARVNHDRLENLSLWLNVFKAEAPVKLRLIYVHAGARMHRIVEFKGSYGDGAKDADERSTSGAWMHIPLESAPIR